jgi:non-ribosomal peptide synthase protein (TIGR01720 family)
VPTRGFGYGVLKYLASESLRAQLRGLPAPRVTFNYLGQFDQSFDAHALLEPARESSGHVHDLDAPLANRLTVTGQVYDGALSLSLGFSRECFRVETIARLARSYRAELTALIDQLDANGATARASE